jgi:hypothetical protein
MLGRWLSYRQGLVRAKMIIFGGSQVRMGQTMNRDDFSLQVKEMLAKRVNWICSNRKCRQPTSGPQVDPEKAINVGVAAHITAASPGGPRYDPNLTNGERQSIQNGIWLCQTCAKLVDNDPTRYTVEVLKEWKALSEAAALLALEGGADDQKRQEEEDNRWAEMYALAIRHLQNIVPRFLNGSPGRAGGSAYGTVFPDLKLRQDIETFLIERKGERMQPRPWTRETLRLQIVRDTIQNVLDSVEELKKSDPGIAGRLGLMQ